MEPNKNGIYYILSRVAMALGTLTKELIVTILPRLAIFIYFAGETRATFSGENIEAVRSLLLTASYITLLGED